MCKKSPMSLSLKAVIQEADRIRFKINSGLLVDGGCGMSAIQTPAKEVWSVTEELTEQGELSPKDQEALLFMLNEATTLQLQAQKFDDFDLIHEYFLQLLEDIK